MKTYNYKKNLKLYKINVMVFICLLVILGAKVINTTRIYRQYKEGEKAYAQQDYIVAQKIYTEVYNKTTFNYFSKKISDILKKEEIIFIKESVVFLEGIKDDFILKMDTNEITAMLDIHNTFNVRLEEVGQSLNNENIVNYNTLIENYNLKTLFSTEFEKRANQFQEDIDNGIAAKNFTGEIDFAIYSQVLAKVILEPDSARQTLEQEMKKYYSAKTDWLIKEDNLENLLVETQGIASEYRGLMKVEWIIDRVTEFVAGKMKESIGSGDYSRYRTLGSRYFTYLSQLPTDLAARNEIMEMASGQLEDDYKKTMDYIINNKFEEAKQMYDAIEEYIVIVQDATIDMEQLNKDIDILWTKNDPIRMFSPLVLREVSKGKSKWGRDAYVVATDADKETLYWGEVNALGETKNLEVDISAYDVDKISISKELSTDESPVIMIEQTDGQGLKYYSAYRIEENFIQNILEMRADSFEMKKQGTVLIGHDSNKLGVKYYELIGGEYINVFNLDDIKLEGLNEYGSVLAGAKNTYSSDSTDTVRVYGTLRKGDNNNDSVNGSLGISYRTPGGNILYYSYGPTDYTWVIPVNTSGEKQIIEGARTMYMVGVYNVEFWWDGLKITETQFRITE